MQSKLHKVMESLTEAFEAVGGKPEYPHWKQQDIDLFTRRGGIDEFFRVPHYVIDDHVRDIILRSDRDASREALQKVGAYRLPHSKMLLESQMSHNPIAPGNTICALIRETVEHTFEVVVILRGDNGEVTPPFIGAFKIDAEGMDYELSSLFAIAEGDKFAALAFDLIDVAILLRHIKGLASGTVEAPAKLNKARAAKKKYPIAGFTHMYIGTVEDASGKSHAYTGRTMPVHMRAGHTRNQRYGKGRELVKTVYIAPVLVNFKQGDEVPVPRRVVKMVA